MTPLEQRIDEARASALDEISEAGDRASLDVVRVKYLARKGLITSLFDELSTVSAAGRPAIGQALNILRRDIETAFETRLEKVTNPVPVASRKA